MPVNFDKRTGIRILNTVKRSEGRSLVNVNRPMNPKRPRSAGGGGAPAMIHAFVKCETPASSPGGTFQLPNPWEYTAPVDDDPAVWTLKTGDGAWTVVGGGGLTHLQILDEDDEPVLLDCTDPLYKRPTVDDMCYVIGDAGATEFYLVDRRCGGGA